MKIGTTLAILHIFGNTPVVNHLFIRVEKGMEIVSWISFKISVGMLFGPKPLLFFKVFIRSDISLVLWAKYKMYLCWEPLDNLKRAFWLEQYFFVDLDLLR